MKWNKITEKLAPINKYVYIHNEKQTRIKYGKLCIYNKTFNLDGCKLIEGDIFWSTIEMDENERCWNTIEIYPYWLSHNDLIELIAEKTEANRLEILDL